MLELTLSRNLVVLSYYGVNLTLTAAEESIASPILQPLLHSIILTNDYFSWEKESLEENPRLMSAVALFMKWQSCSATEAKQLVKSKIIDLEEEYLAQKTAYLQKPGSRDTYPSVCRAFDLVEAIAAGLFLFDMTCPRYHCPGDNVYQSYFESRAKDGYLFFDSCTDSEDLLRCGSLNGVVNGTKRMEIDNSTRKNGAVNGASQMPSAFINLALKPLAYDVCIEQTYYPTETRADNQLGPTISIQLHIINARQRSAWGSAECDELVVSSPTRDTGQDQGSGKGCAHFVFDVRSPFPESSP